MTPLPGYNQLINNTSNSFDGGSHADTSNSLSASNSRDTSDSRDSMESYFECITACSLDDGECVTQCVEILREPC